MISGDRFSGSEFPEITAFTQDSQSDFVADPATRLKLKTYSDIFPSVFSKTERNARLKHRDESVIVSCQQLYMASHRAVPSALSTVFHTQKILDQLLQLTLKYNKKLLQRYLSILLQCPQQNGDIPFHRVLRSSQHTIFSVMRFPQSAVGSASVLRYPPFNPKNRE